MTGRRSQGTRARVAAVALAWAALVGTDAAGAAPAHADARAPRFGASAVIAPGVAYQTFTVAVRTSAGGAERPVPNGIGVFTRHQFRKPVTAHSFE